MLPVTATSSSIGAGQVDGIYSAGEVHGHRAALTGAADARCVAAVIVERASPAETACADGEEIERHIAARLGESDRPATAQATASAFTIGRCGKAGPADGAAVDNDIDCTAYAITATGRRTRPECREARAHPTISCNLNTKEGELRQIIIGEPDGDRTATPVR